MIQELLTRRRLKRQEERELEEIARPIENIEEDLNQIGNFLDEFRKCQNKETKLQIAYAIPCCIENLISRMIETATYGVMVEQKLYERTIGILKIASDTLARCPNTRHCFNYINNRINSLEEAYR